MKIKILTVSFFILSTSVFAMDWEYTENNQEKNEEYKQLIQNLFLQSQAAFVPEPEKPTMVIREDAATLQERYAKINNQKKKTYNAKYRKN